MGEKFTLLGFSLCEKLFIIEKLSHLNFEMVSQAPIPPVYHSRHTNIHLSESASSDKIFDGICNFIKRALGSPCS